MRHFLYMDDSGRHPLPECKDRTARFFRKALAECGNEVHALAEVESGMTAPMDAVFVQDALGCRSLQEWREKYADIPWFFVSADDRIAGYAPPWKNLFGAFVLGNADLSLSGIPEEMQVRLSCPVLEFDDSYFYEPQPQVCRLAYFPTGNNVENDRILFDFCRKSNVELTVVSDEYLRVSDALPASIRVVPSGHGGQILRNAHIVLASGYEALSAMASCKPCIVFGDYGLGGLVTSRNYGLLEEVSFHGRKGGCFREVIPARLLETVIQSVFIADCGEEMHKVQQLVREHHSWNRFVTAVNGVVDRAMALRDALQDAGRRQELKPRLSSLARLEEKDGKFVLWRGMACFGELYDEMASVLRQCDGSLSVARLSALNSFCAEDAEVLWQNLLALWDEKIILFEP